MATVPPSRDDLSALLGSRALAAWDRLNARVADNYAGFTPLWSANNKAGAYELKYRRSGKTLCAFYAREKHFGFMLIFGKDERAKFESRRDEFPPAIARVYDAATTYHDGKWMMFEVRNGKDLAGLPEMLAIKRRPDRASGEK